LPCPPGFVSLPPANHGGDGRMFDFKGKRVVVCGGSRGIGR
jgi:hypothetical protein